jgi:RimJ/RimL family protein N-acetyltransferase
MRLRKLETKDAPAMLEWMHDKSVVTDLNTDFSSKTLEDCVTFIESSRRNKDNLHLAITDELDEYLGTVSLKHIKDKTAEFGIVVRKKAMRRGYAWFGMEEIMKVAFEDLKLESVYWCVNKSNERAIRFYEKHNFHQVKDISKDVLERYKGNDCLIWYSVLKGDEINIRDVVAGCRVIHIKTIPTINAGELSFFEGTHDVSFDVKRMYYISKVPEGTRRGFHAHKKLKQLLFCPYGRIQLILENKNGREEIELSDPSIGVVIEEPTWREMLWLQKDSVLCIAASDFYNAEDYIRDYDEFKKYLERDQV